MSTVILFILHAPNSSHLHFLSLLPMRNCSLLFCFHFIKFLSRDIVHFLQSDVKRYRLKIELCWCNKKNKNNKTVLYWFHWIDFFTNRNAKTNWEISLKFEHFCNQWFLWSIILSIIMTPQHYKNTENKQSCLRLSIVTMQYSNNYLS